ncbi:MAG: amino acid permease [Pirellulales bacterium]|nr:amino acid permease [Pirellulales bacterium]
MSPPTEARPSTRLQPVLGLFGATALVVGATIGTGIFLMPSFVAQGTGGYFGLILTLWIGCGVINLCGALALAELAALLPEGGGTYVFLREAYGRRWAFLWVWAEFWVMRSGAIAALAVVVAENLVRLVAVAPGATADPPWFKGTVVAVAAGTIVVLTAVNVLGTRFGSAVQTLTTLIKGAAILILAVLPLALGRASTEHLAPVWPAQIDDSILVQIGVALAAIAWAYDGWGMVTVISEEVHEPARNVPRALVLGVLIVIGLYAAANTAYHLTLPSEQIRTLPNTAATVAGTLLGPWGAQCLLSVLVISALGALNANILVGPRVLYSVAADYPRLALLKRIDPRFATPAVAIISLAAWAGMLLLADELSPDKNKRLFQILIEYVVFGGSIFYLSAVVAVFVMRLRRPDAPRPYRTWGYPVTPALFAAFYVFFLGSMLVSSFWQALAGLGFIGLGALAHALLSAATPLPSPTSSSWDGPASR